MKAPVSRDEPSYLLPRRIGRFLLSIELIENQPNDVRRIFEDMIVVRAEALYFPRAIEYCAICDAFDEIEPGPDIPLYHPFVSKTPDAVFTIAWQRVEPAA